jgi:hypothetical protein
MSSTACGTANGSRATGSIRSNASRLRRPAQRLSTARPRQRPLLACRQWHVGLAEKFEQVRRVGVAGRTGTLPSTHAMARTVISGETSASAMAKLSSGSAPSVPMPG